MYISILKLEFFAGLNHNLYLVDHMTSLAQIYPEKVKRNLFVFRCPIVSGGDVGAKNGTFNCYGWRIKENSISLQIFFGGVLDYHLFGPAGSGQLVLKMANQIMIAGTMTGLTEVIDTLKAGLDLDSILTTVETGSLDNWSVKLQSPQFTT